MKHRKGFPALLLCLLLLSGCSYAPAATAPPADDPAETSSPVQPAGTPADEAFDIAVSWANWTDDDAIDSGALNSEKLAISSTQHLPIYRFDTPEELEQFKASFEGVLSMDGRYDEIPSFAEVTAELDEAFFEEHSLILVYVTAGSGSFRFGVNSIFCDGDAFCIHVEQLNHPEAYTCDMAGWFVTAAVPDSMVSTCTEFDADLNNTPA